MRTPLFYLLFLVLTADGLMSFLTLVVVYMLTGSIEYSGLSYAIWWLPRLLLIPVIGQFIDRLGIRALSIFSDLVKAVGCLFLALYAFQSPLAISIAFGIVGSLVSIGNSQTLIAYEKIIATLSDNRSHHINLMSRMDFLGMILGPVIGILLIDYGYQGLLLLTCLFYLVNAGYFFFTRLNFEQVEEEDKDQASEPVATSTALRVIASSPLLLALIGLAIGNNMFDGLIESSGTAIIDRSMELPVKYFGLIDVAAGLFGVAGTYLYGLLAPKSTGWQLLSLGLLLIILPSLALIAFPGYLWIFVSCYAITIMGKVITGNIGRMVRIEVIPTPILASTSSIIVFLNQLILPVVGASLFFFGEISGMVYAMMAAAVLASLVSGTLLTLMIRKQVPVQVIASR